LANRQKLVSNKKDLLFSGGVCQVWHRLRGRGGNLRWSSQAAHTRLQNRYQPFSGLHLLYSLLCYHVCMLSPCSVRSHPRAAVQGGCNCNHRASLVLNVLKRSGHLCPSQTSYLSFVSTVLSSVSRGLSSLIRYICPLSQQSCPLSQEVCPL
jgi:hypothetical protein